MTDKTEHLQKHYDDIVRCLICSSKFCMRWCPSFEATKSESVFSAGLNHFALGILTGMVEYTPSAVEQIYTCLSCGSCRDIRCVAEYLGPSVDTPLIMEAMRADIVESGKAPAEVEAIAQKAAETHNIYGETELPKGSGAQAPVLRAGEEPEMLYFAGCALQFKYPELINSVFEITDKVGTSARVLSDEHCCGMPLLRMGYRQQAEEMARHNLERINNSGAQSVSFSCPSCFRAFVEIYPAEFDLHLEIDASLVLEYIDDNLQSGKLALGTEVEQTITIHDSCNLALARKEIDLPRRVMSQIPGLTVQEMERSGAETRCCGGALWVKALHPELSQAHGRRRLEDVSETGASAVATVCPSCWRALGEATDLDEADYRIADVVELVANAL